MGKIGPLGGQVWFSFLVQSSYPNGIWTSSGFICSAFLKYMWHVNHQWSLRYWACRMGIHNTRLLKVCLRACFSLIHILIHKYSSYFDLRGWSRNCHDSGFGCRQFLNWPFIYIWCSAFLLLCGMLIFPHFLCPLCWRAEQVFNYTVLKWLC